MKITNEANRKATAKRLLLDPMRSKIKTFAILTAENPNMKAVPKKDNIAYNNQLKSLIGYRLDKNTEDDTEITPDSLERTLIVGHYPYYKVRGHYGGNTEHSFLIYNITLEEAKHLSKLFHQQSFIFGKNEDGHITFEFWANRSKNDYVYDISDSKDWFENASDFKDFYSKVSKDFSFSIPFEAFGFDDEDMYEFWNRADEKSIIESLDDKITGFERMRKRSMAYNKKKTPIVYDDDYLINTLEYATDNGRAVRPIDEATLNRIVNKHDSDGYVIISACRSKFFKADGKEVPRGVEAVTSLDSPKDYVKCLDDCYGDLSNKVVYEEDLMSGDALARVNNARTIALKNDIISNDFAFLPVYGGFKEEGSTVASFEKSFIVFNYNRKGELQDMKRLYDTCMSLGIKYNQDSILVKKPDSHPYYAVCCAGESGTVDFEFDGNYTLNDMTQMYFTALKKIKDDENLKKGLPQRFTFEGVYINPAPESVHEATRRHYRCEMF